MRQINNLKKNDPETYLRYSNALLPDVLKHHNPANSEEDMLNERRVEHFWLKKIDIYVYVMLLGNTVDGMPLSLHFAYILSGGVYNLVHLLGCFFLILPMMYMELFLGYYTKLTNVQMFRMAPIFFGFCIWILIINACYIPLMLNEVSQLLLIAVKYMINSDMMNSCPENTADCYDFLKQGPLNTTCQQVYLGMKCDGIEDIVRYVTLYRTWEMRQNVNEFIDWKILLITIITWLCLCLFLIIGLQFLGKLLCTIFALNLFINILIFIISLMDTGSIKGMSNMITFHFNLNWSYTDVCMTIAFITSRWGLIRPSGYMTLSAYAVNLKFGNGLQTFVLISLNYLFNLWQMIVSLSISGVLAEAMGVESKTVHLKGAELYSAVYTQFLNNHGASLSFVIIILLLYWLLEISKLSIVLHMYILNINDCIPMLIRYRNYVIPATVLIGILISTSSMYLYIQYSFPLLKINMIHGEQCFLLFIQSILMFYCYGVDRIYNDIYYITGSTPLKLWRIIAYSYPVITMVMIFNLFVQPPPIQFLLDQYQTNNKLYTAYISSLLLIMIETIIMSVLSMIYALLQINKNKRDLLKPQFYFGPPDAISRMGRKYLCDTSARYRRKRQPKIRFRLFSVRFEHRLDELQQSSRGRLFLEDEFDVNVDRPELRDLYNYNKGRMLKRLAKKKMVNMRVQFDT